jgi:Flp pilus assembly protein TadG
MRQPEAGGGGVQKLGGWGSERVNALRNTRSLSHSSRPPQGSRRGSAVIEAGLTIVLLFGLMLLIMDLAMVLFIKSTLQQAVREGVRVGVTARLVGSTAYLNDSITQTVQENSLGFLNGAQGACRIRIQYFDPNTGAPSLGTQGDLLVVSVENYNYTVLGAILKSAHPVPISVSASDILERCPVGGCPAAVNPNPIPCPS